MPHQVAECLKNHHRNILLHREHQVNIISTSRITPFRGTADIFEHIAGRADPLHEDVPVTAVAIAAHDGFGGPLYVVEWHDGDRRRLSYATEIKGAD